MSGVDAACAEVEGHVTSLMAELRALTATLEQRT